LCPAALDSGRDFLAGKAFTWHSNLPDAKG
jgi:hypothetical protein